MVNREYDYIRGNTAINPQRKYEDFDKRVDRENLERRKREEQKREKDLKKSFVKNVLQVASIALILGLVNIGINGKVYKLQKQLISVNKEISIAKAEGEAIRVDLLKYASIEDIKESSKAKGMKTPTKDDTVVINITKDFFENIK
ncbi:cell division protein FtsL [Clostridium sp.]|uniref:cell division protein FtsL n=1 Tax=Clostridium sp. TaxID=1506 RepID=UPI0026398525|nr:cell division protein FtsL [Clostridium sp.]